MIGVVKLTASGVSFIPATISFWTVGASLSWVFLACFVPSNDGDEPGRRLSAFEQSGELSTAIVFIILGLIAHYVCNVLFVWKFFTEIFKKDSEFIEWRRIHKGTAVTVTVISGTISFHFIRMFYSSLCNKEYFKAKFEAKQKVYKLLLFFGYVDIVSTHILLIIA